MRIVGSPSRPGRPETLQVRPQGSVCYHALQVKLSMPKFDRDAVEHIRVETSFGLVVGWWPEHIVVFLCQCPGATTANYYKSCAFKTGVPWLDETWLPSLPLLSHGSLLVCVPMCPLLFSGSHQTLDSGHPLIQGDLIFTYCSCRDHKVTF